MPYMLCQLASIGLLCLYIYAVYACNCGSMWLVMFIIFMPYMLANVAACGLC